MIRPGTAEMRRQAPPPRARSKAVLNPGGAMAIGYLPESACHGWGRRQSRGWDGVRAMQCFTGKREGAKSRAITSIGE